MRIAEPNTELYGFAVFGGCLLVVEMANALVHFGIAYPSCTLLLSSAILLRTIYLAEEVRTPEGSAQDAEGIPVSELPLRAGPL